MDIENKPKTEEELLQEELDKVRNARSEADKVRRIADLKRQIEAEKLDARAEEIAEKLAEQLGQRGVDYDVVTGGGRIIAVKRPPGPAWEQFQKYVTKMITADEAVPAHQYRNLARSCLVRPEGDEFADLVTKEDFDGLAARYPNMAQKLVNTVLHDLADGGAKRRQGK